MSGRGRPFPPLRFSAFVGRSLMRCGFVTVDRIAGSRKFLRRIPRLCQSLKPSVPSRRSSGTSGRRLVTCLRVSSW
jgi:hypothetical protein